MHSSRYPVEQRTVDGKAVSDIEGRSLFDGLGLETSNESPENARKLEGSQSHSNNRDVS